MLLGTPQPEAGCDSKLWQEAGMSSYTYCTVISSSAQLSPGCTSVQVLRSHMATAALNSAQAAKAHGNPREAPQSSVPALLTWKEEPWELKAIQCYQSTLPTFVSLCFTHTERSGFNHPPHLSKHSLHKGVKDGKFIRQCNDGNCRATSK